MLTIQFCSQAWEWGLRLKNEAEVSLWAILFNLPEISTLWLLRGQGTWPQRRVREGGSSVSYIHTSSNSNQARGNRGLSQLGPLRENPPDSALKSVPVTASRMDFSRVGLEKFISRDPWAESGLQMCFVWPKRF